MNSFSFHVPASNYRRRPSVRLAVRSTRQPFRDSALAWVVGSVALQFAILILCAVNS